MRKLLAGLACIIILCGISSVSSAQSGTGDIFFDFSYISGWNPSPPNTINTAYTQQGVTLLINNFNPYLPIPGSSGQPLLYHPTTLGQGTISFSQNVLLSSLLVKSLDGLPIAVSLFDSQGHLAGAMSSTSSIIDFTSLSPRIKTIEFDATGSHNFIVNGIHASPVPLPGAVWLLGAGVAGVGCLRRRFGAKG